ncbi:probable acyl-[acyl-carrier-protein]--UDP-N-acetylglucosamine O-acyltransferase, mitochondrial isoform X5 [Camellia sinensis]|uniref:probable acyl-[acyl-carrier-protein]--UDP-N-acetylglucosamine O-acyltransferase, mitochondrial isoform X5 n=1 Tax=Camellia sinensis TaxID=4442 RepID=UPI0010362572|nr:probable acyl-[acyl-carrier-protein]--UDP-N-acetylglucosamine O-acyltransferase, mitochondrial isoform X5 [Camellia sinensis]
MSSSSLLQLLRRPLSSALRIRSLSLQHFSTSLPHILEETKDNAKIGRNPSFIHPAAIVHSGAVIGQGVSIGPFCTVGSSAKLGNSCQLYPGSHIFGNTELGDHCILMSGAVVGDDLPGHTVIGCNNVIGHHSLVGIKCQDMKYKSGDECFLEIGDNNEIREYASIHRSSKPSEKTVSQDVPKYMMVSGERAELRGLNLEGLKRCGFSDTEIRSLRTAYRKIFMSTDANSGGIENRLAEVEKHEELAYVPAVCLMVQSIRDSFSEDRRGICKSRSLSVS